MKTFFLLFFTIFIINKSLVAQNYSSVTDIDGNKYETVKIGNQVWMEENLRVTRYNDGTPIPNVTNFKDWISLHSGAYCIYNNDYSYKPILGALYNWYTVNTGKLAPKGWHVPSFDDWNNLINYLGGYEEACKKLKSERGAWKNSSCYQTNSSGFQALPHGERDMNEDFQKLGNIVCWWSTNSKNDDYALGILLSDDLFCNTIQRLSTIKLEGHSIRCIKDETIHKEIETNQNSSQSTSTQNVKKPSELLKYGEWSQFQKMLSNQELYY